jgi:imidazolonepropionase-like amidohydrolase
MFLPALALGLLAAAADKPTLALVGGQVIDGYEEKDLGTLASGRLADVIAVRGDVLSTIELLQHVDVVVKDGKRVK